MAVVIIEVVDDDEHRVQDVAAELRTAPLLHANSQPGLSIVVGTGLSDLQFAICNLQSSLLVPVTGKQSYQSHHHRTFFQWDPDNDQTRPSCFPVVIGRLQDGVG